jgi:hypothetical protein
MDKNPTRGEVMKSVRNLSEEVERLRVTVEHTEHYQDLEIKRLERLIEVKNEALRSVRDTPQERHEEFWHLTKRLRQIAQSALEQE